MKKAFSIASWNVEHFKGQTNRVNRVVDFLIDKDGGNKPDVFALYEVEGKDVYSALATKMAGYTFHITEGAQSQEILVGISNKLTAFFTQRIEFKTGNNFLRPGALLTVKKNDIDYTILFLHTKSMTSPVGFGLRDEMLSRATKFRRKMEKKNEMPKWSSKYLFMGDLNTMGLEYPFDKDIASTIELDRLDGRAKYAKMRRLIKSADNTFWNGTRSSYPKSDLDHVVASNNLTFKSFGEASVSVRGWVTKDSDAEADTWISQYSDHSLLYMEVMED